MAATVAAALQRAQREHDNPTRDWTGWCLRFTRTCLGIPFDGTRTAIDAWARADHRHVNGTPPAGAPVFWVVGEFGHVALSDGKGNVWSNDILRPGKIDRVAIPTITRRWGARYLGWTEDLNGVRIPFPPGPNLTIAMRAVQMAAAGETVTDSYLADVRQVLAWARKRRIITPATEQAWVKTRDPRHLIDAIENIQRAEHLLVTRTWNVATARTMERFGYTVIDVHGKAL